MSRKEELEELFERLESDLNLSQEQGARIRHLLNDHMRQRKAIRQEQDEKEARKQAIKPLVKELRKNIGTVLDEQQEATFKQNKDQYKALLRDN